MENKDMVTMPLAELLFEQRQAGRKEVVEWIEKQTSNGDIISVDWDGLEAQKKVWGIE